MCPCSNDISQLFNLKSSCQIRLLWKHGSYLVFGYEEKKERGTYIDHTNMDGGETLCNWANVLR